MTGRRGRQRVELLEWMMNRLGGRDERQLGKIARDRRRWEETAIP